MLAGGLAPADRRAAVLRAGQLLEPDDVTFSVMMRGYGDSDPPQWTAISTLLGVMQSRFQMKPSTGVATDGRCFKSLVCAAPACSCGDGASKMGPCCTANYMTAQHCFSVCRGRLSDGRWR